MWRDAAIVLMAAGATIVAFAGGLWLRNLARRRPWADVLDMIAPEPPRVVVPLRCICTARLGFCDCAIDGVRNPRGAGRGRSVYCCGTCGTSDRTAFVRCHHPLCPDGRDQVRQ